MGGNNQLFPHRLLAWDLHSPAYYVSILQVLLKCLIRVYKYFSWRFFSFIQITLISLTCMITLIGGILRNCCCRILHFKSGLTSSTCLLLRASCLLQYHCAELSYVVFPISNIHRIFCLHIWCVCCHWLIIFISWMLIIAKVSIDWLEESVVDYVSSVQAPLQWFHSLLDWTIKETSLFLKD